MGNYNFKKDFSNSKKNVKFICELISKRETVCYAAEVPKEEQINGDIEVQCINGDFYYLECKEDFTCKKTNNLAIECFSRGKPSGIAISKAHYWAITSHLKDGIEILLIKTEQLRDLIKEKKYKFLHKDGGDKNSNTHNYLFDLSVIKQYSHTLFSEKGANIQ